MLKVSGKTLSKHYGISTDAFQKQLSEHDAKINNLPDLIKMIIYYQLENRKRKDKSKGIIK